MIVLFPYFCVCVHADWRCANSIIKSRRNKRVRTISTSPIVKSTALSISDARSLTTKLLNSIDSLSVRPYLLWQMFVRFLRLLNLSNRNILDIEIIKKWSYRINYHLRIWYFFLSHGANNQESHFRQTDWGIPSELDSHSFSEEKILPRHSYRPRRMAHLIFACKYLSFRGRRIDC